MTISIVQYARRYSLSSAPNSFCRFSRTHASRYTDENAFWAKAKDNPLLLISGSKVRALVRPPSKYLPHYDRARMARSTDHFALRQ